MDLASLSSGLQDHLKTSLEPIGVAYVAEPPAGIAHGVAGPASCSYWKRAADGEVFYTAADERGEVRRADGVIGTMVG